MYSLEGEKTEKETNKRIRESGLHAKLTHRIECVNFFLLRLFGKKVMEAMKEKPRWYFLLFISLIILLKLVCVSELRMSSQ